MQMAIESAPAQGQRLVLVDGSGYIFRAYHALPPLTRTDGTPVGAVYGFTSMLLALRETMHADYLAVIFDAARVTFRNAIYPEYKAHRPAPPEDLVPQFALVREATQALNIPAIEMPNFEADDLIATYAMQARAKGMEVLIVSSDKDLMQLIADGVQLYEPMKQKLLGRQAVQEKFGVTPDKVIEVQALIGDAVDNVPGVPGIGPKTAAELIGQYGTVENLLNHLHEIKQPKRRQSLEENAQKARLSRQLVELKCDVEVPQALESLTVQALDKDRLVAFLQAQQFKALLKRVGAQGAVPGASAPVSAVVSTSGAPASALPAAAMSPASAPMLTRYELVQDINTLETWIARATRAGRVAIDTETTSLDAVQAALVGISLCVEAGHACYIPVAHVSEVRVTGPSQGSLFGESQEQPQEIRLERIASQLSVAEVSKALAPLLADKSVVKIGHNIKYDMQVLARHGMPLHVVHDTMLMSYCTGAGLHAHNLDDLAMLHFGHATTSFKSLVGGGKSQITFAQVPLDAACHYAAEDADITLRLYEKLQPELAAQSVTRIYERIERPLLPVIVAMEGAGIKVDEAKLRALSEELAQGLGRLEQEIHHLAGHPFNIASPKQLGEVLFDEMGFSGGKKSSKTGAYATGAEVLEELTSQGHLLPEKVLAWRQLAKLKSTYTDALAGDINPHTGRIHTSFSLAAASTGRLSSSDPNLQNIPIRTHEGKRIREAFVAQEGYKLISADYSQIELRLLAHMADISTLKKAFASGADIHAITASQMFGVPHDKVDGELRRRAKTINFGIIYGISAHGLAVRLGIGRTEAAEYIAAYFAQYPGIKAYMDECKQMAHAQGYIETLYGRRVYVKDINASNPNLRAFSERAAINAPLQGTAADIIKKAMVAVHTMLMNRFPRARLLLQVHDELIVEAPEAQAHEVAEQLKACMSGAAQLSVPLLVEAGIGDNWGEIH